ncbi:class I SAM-dependent methyltransferase [Sulfurimonas sp.]|uniref:class I SAM-dependent methyltransferase n=1 Tax=Sulfurimonas sp. TaxID=2022749 RepID=UPI00356ADE22
MAKDLNVGKYHKSVDEYSDLINEVYKNYPDGVNLPPMYAQFIDKSMSNILIRLSRYKFVAKMLKPTDEVLEVGCGSGLGSIYLSQNCKSVYGIDVQKQEIAEAQELSRRDNVKFEVKDLFLLDEEKKYDSIVCLDVLEHLSIEDGRKFIEKISKLLKPNGFFACGVPSIYSYEFQSPLSQASHINCPDRDDLERELSINFDRIFPFSMNDEMVHTGFQKLAWYYIMLCTSPKD